MIKHSRQKLINYCFFTLCLTPLFLYCQVTITKEKGKTDSSLLIDVEPSLKGQNIQPISSESRAKDYKSAFDELRSKNSSGQIYLIVKGRTLTPIQEIEVMSKKTLLLVSIGRKEPYRYEVIQIEEIERMGMFSKRSKILID